MYMEGLDQKDQEILKVLENHARLSYSEIAEKVGLSRVAVKNRILALEKKGVIQGYRTIIDSAKASDSIRFFLDVEAEPEQWDAVVQTLTKSPMLRQIYVVSGECRLHAIGTASSMASLDAYAKHLYHKVKGIRRIGCHTVLSTLQDLDGGIHYDQDQGSDNLEG